MMESCSEWDGEADGDVDTTAEEWDSAPPPAVGTRRMHKGTWKEGVMTCNRELGFEPKESSTALHIKATKSWH